jgi:hypothetical protein
MAELAARGARFPDVTRIIDEYIARLGTMPDDQIRIDYAKIQRFYFAHTDDPAREAPFRARLGLAP